MSSAYGWTPEVLGDMTISQMYHWGADTPDVDGTKNMSLEESYRYTANITAAKEKWIKRAREAAGV